MHDKPLCHHKEIIFVESLPKIVQIQPKRTLKDIDILLKKSSLSDKSKKVALDIFYIIAKAETKAHNIDINEVEFHETGAMDSIIDVVSAVSCIEQLGIDEVLSCPLNEGYGQIMCKRGMLDIPVTAVKNIAKEHNISLNRVDFEGELITPTGIGLLAGIAIPSRNFIISSQKDNALSLLEQSTQRQTNFNILSVGYGYGK